MQSLVETALSNALVASLLAVLAFVVSRWRRPALAHALWLLVLLKLVTPPLVPVAVPWPLPVPAADDPPAPPRVQRLAHAAEPLPDPADALPLLPEAAGADTRPL